MHDQIHEQTYMDTLHLCLSFSV